MTVLNNFSIKLISARNTKTSLGTQPLYNYLWLEQLGETHFQLSVMPKKEDNTLKWFAKFCVLS